MAEPAFELVEPGTGNDRYNDLPRLEGSRQLRQKRVEDVRLDGDHRQIGMLDRGTVVAEDLDAVALADLGPAAGLNVAAAYLRRKHPPAGDKRRDDRFTHHAAADNRDAMLAKDVMLELLSFLKHFRFPFRPLDSATVHERHVRPLSLLTRVMAGPQTPNGRWMRPLHSALAGLLCYSGIVQPAGERAFGAAGMVGGEGRNWARRRVRRDDDHHWPGGAKEPVVLT